MLLLLCNLFVNITLTGLINSLVTAILGRSATHWSFLAATVTIITFGEVLPKSCALRWNESIASAAAPVLNTLKVLTSPLLDMIQRINRFFLERFKVHLRRPSPFITLDELKSAVRSSFERGVISKSEQRVISTLLDRGALPAERFMIHRSQAVFLPHYTSAADALKELVAAEQTCALVTSGTRGRQVTGIVSLSDLLCAPPSTRCRQLALPPHWTPGTLEAADLISFMFAEKLSVVCLLDEFGGMSGIFSLSETLNKVMNFQQERSMGSAGGAKTFPGLQELDGMSGWLPESLVSEIRDARTLNGLLTRRLGRIPKTGEFFDIEGYIFYIIHSGPARIESVSIRKGDFRDENIE